MSPSRKLAQKTLGLEKKDGRARGGAVISSEGKKIYEDGKALVFQTALGEGSMHLWAQTWG